MSANNGNNINEGFNSGQYKQEWWSFSQLQILISQGHPLMLVVVLPFLILIVRVHIKLISWLYNMAIKNDRNPGLFMPKHVHGSVFPYGVVELKGRRPYMEDRHLVVTNILEKSDVSLYGVFDGHGGAAASQYCVDYLSSIINDSPFNLLQKPKQALTHTFKTLDQRFLEKAHAQKLDDGTTAIVALFIGTSVQVANTGDSRAIIVRKNGQTMPLSRDHKPDRNDERDRIARLGGSVVHWGVWRVEGILAVSRAIGDRMLKEYVIPDPELVEWKVSTEDMYLVLATDGLWDVLDEAEVGKILLKVRTAQEGSEILTQKAFELGSQDNVTVLVIDVRNLSNFSCDKSKTDEYILKRSKSSELGPTVVDGSSGSISMKHQK